MVEATAVIPAIAGADREVGGRAFLVTTADAGIHRGSPAAALDGLLKGFILSRRHHAPAAQNASASIAMTVSAPALSVVSRDAVLGRRRWTKNLAVASFAR